MARKLRPNLRATEEQAMLGGMVSMLQALGFVNRVEARKDGMRLHARNGLTVSVVPGEAYRDGYAEVGWWETGSRDVAGTQVEGVGNPDQLSDLLARLVTLKLHDERRGVGKWASFLNWLAA